MKISLDHISKRFLRHWIFRDINISLIAPGSYALLGSNGSGKSTLLRMVAGIQNPTRGKIIYEDATGKQIPGDKIYSQISFCAPSQEIIEEMTLEEFLRFHFSFKPIIQGIDIQDIISIIGLENARNKQLNDYSSGMKQRVKLAQAIFSAAPVLLLDEPCTNLDDDGVQQYRYWIETYTQGKLVVVASNDAREYYFCRYQYRMEDYK